MQLALLLSAALAFALGGVFMKHSNGLSELVPSLLVFLLFSLGAASQTFGMRQAEMGSVYIFVLGAETILAFAFSVALLHEGVSGTKVIAVALVALGIMLLDA